LQNRSLKYKHSRIILHLQYKTKIKYVLKKYHALVKFFVQCITHYHNKFKNKINNIQKKKKTR